MKIKNILLATTTAIALSISAIASAADHKIKAGARAFEIEVLYVAVGDKVGFTNMNSHNTVSVDGLIPEGAEAWRSGMGENLGLSMDVPGIYSYVCEPHIGFGMVGVIVVGDITQADIDAYKQKAMDTLKGPWRRLLGKINKIKPTV
ncbi:MAG: plastocyanin/azurin family copper-binding protein [Pseudomonadota bacterium]